MISEPRSNADLDGERPAPAWATKRFTLDEFLALPDDTPHFEFDNGAVTQKVAAKPTHGSVQALLTTLFNQHAHPRRLGIAFSEVRFVTPTWAPIPDVAFYRRGRIRRRGRRPPADFFEAPDLTVEIVSPEQSATEMIQKSLRYLALGTTVAIVVDPAPETVSLFRDGQPLLLLQGDDRIELDDVLPGFTLTVSAMFDALAPDWLDDDDEDDAHTAQGGTPRK